MHRSNNRSFEQKSNRDLNRSLKNESWYTSIRANPNHDSDRFGPTRIMIQIDSGQLESWFRSIRPTSNHVSDRCGQPRIMIRIDLLINRYISKNQKIERSIHSLTSTNRALAIAAGYFIGPLIRLIFPRLKKSSVVAPFRSSNSWSIVASAPAGCEVFKAFPALPCNFSGSSSP